MSNVQNNEAAPAPVMPHIAHVVVLMLENRSFDNVLGFLHPEGTPGFNGASTHYANAYHGKSYHVQQGSPSLTLNGDWYQQPAYDPGEGFAHVQKQLYGDNTGQLQDAKGGDLYDLTPNMQGFAWDYDELYTNNLSVMGSYTPSQLPILNGIAAHFAVCDAWFSSVPTQTFANRAFSLCGTSLGAVDNHEINGSTYQDLKTLFNVLGEAGKSWGIYWQNEWPASGAPLFDVFTPWLLPQIHAAPNGGVFPYSDPQHPQSFLQALAANALPAFSFLEPKWGGGPSIVLSLNGNDYHPVSDVRQAEHDLCHLFNAIISSEAWPNMLFVILFDEHGGTYDHQAPPPAVSPDGIKSHTGFQFNRLGVRVPAILVSPFIASGTLFGTSTDQVFDHTSLIATLLKWAGVDPASGVMGQRVAQATTFEAVLQAETQQPSPAKLGVDPGWNLDPAAVHATRSSVFEKAGVEPLDLPMKLAEYRGVLHGLGRKK